MSAAFGIGVVVIGGLAVVASLRSRTAAAPIEAVGSPSTSSPALRAGHRRRHRARHLHHGKQVSDPGSSGRHRAPASGRHRARRAAQPHRPRRLRRGDLLAGGGGRRPRLRRRAARCRGRSRGSTGCAAKASGSLCWPRGERGAAALELAGIADRFDVVITGSHAEQLVRARVRRTRRRARSGGRRRRRSQRPGGGARGGRGTGDRRRARASPRPSNSAAPAPTRSSPTFRNCSAAPEPATLSPEPTPLDVVPPRGAVPTRLIDQAAVASAAAACGGPRRWAPLGLGRVAVLGQSLRDRGRSVEVDQHTFRCLARGQFRCGARLVSIGQSQALVVQRPCGRAADDADPEGRRAREHEDPPTAAPLPVLRAPRCPA